MLISTVRVWCSSHDNRKRESEWGRLLVCVCSGHLVRTVHDKCRVIYFLEKWPLSTGYDCLVLSYQRSFVRRYSSVAYSSVFTCYTFLPSLSFNSLSIEIHRCSVPRSLMFDVFAILYLEDVNSAITRPVHSVSMRYSDITNSTYDMISSLETPHTK